MLFTNWSPESWIQQLGLSTTAPLCTFMVPKVHFQNVCAHAGVNGAIRMRAFAGIGKSHALRYTAARLWHRRLRKSGNFRILYVADWAKIGLADLQNELRLCFHDNLDALHDIDAVTCAQHVQRLMSTYSTERIVVILDQAFDTVAGDTTNHMFRFFPEMARHIRYVFASSPRFDLQGHYLQADSNTAIPVPFMARLTAVECLAMILHSEEDVPLLKGMHKQTIFTVLMLCVVNLKMSIVTWATAVQGELQNEQQIQQLLPVIDTNVAPRAATQLADATHEAEKTPAAVAEDAAWPPGAAILELLLEASGACQWAPEMPQSHR